METRRLNNREALCLGWISQVFQGCLERHRYSSGHGIAFDSLIFWIQDFLNDSTIDRRIFFEEIGRLRAIQGRDAQYEIGFLLGCAFIAFPRLLCELFESTEEECSLDQGEFLKGLAIGMCDGYVIFIYPDITPLMANDLGASFAKACSGRVNPDLSPAEDDAIGQSIAKAKKLLRRRFFELFHGGMVGERRKMNEAQRKCLDYGIGGAMNLHIFYKLLSLTSSQIYEAIG